MVDRLRFKTYLMILPIIAVTVVLSGFLSFMQSRTALTRMANRHLAYKAEQLRDFINNEWTTIENLGLADQSGYREAEEESFRSYAYSLLREESERILVFDERGFLAFGIGGSVGAGFLAADRPIEPWPLPAGWFSRSVFGEELVGVAFDFPPFRWTIAVTDSRASYFSDIQGILRINVLILVAAVLGAAALAAVYLGYLVGPIERLEKTIERISETGDLSCRAEVEYSDEIGLLAHRFNSLIGALQKRDAELEETNRAERRAHETAVQREIETLFLLGKISDYNDLTTGEHLSRIGTLSAHFSAILGQSEEERNSIRNSSPLHDIGKIAIPDAILLKPGKLTDEEFEVIKRHTVLGHELLKNCQSQYLAEGALIALTHHEKWDGGGYPRGLAGTDIPIQGRIVSVVDVFDALTSDRPYKQAWPVDRALDFIVSQRGAHFDPELVDLFKDRFQEFASLIGRE
jgi:response regulator RpfG family c-di-GMP phosphodiesterase